MSAAVNERASAAVGADPELPAAKGEGVIAAVVVYSAPAPLKTKMR